MPGEIEPVLNPGYNPPFYRNQLLAETMVKLNMIDSQSTGIRRVFRIQKERYFPLPDYDLSNRQQVRVCILSLIHILYIKDIVERKRIERQDILEDVYKRQEHLLYHHHEGENTDQNSRVCL